MTGTPEPLSYKTCAYCRESKPVTDYARRTGRRAGKQARRGPCRACRSLSKKEPASPLLTNATEIGAPKPDPEAVFRAWRLPPLPVPQPNSRPSGPDASILRPNRQGVVGMRGKSDKGRRWYQETDLETAVVLVKEHAAVVVNRHTIKRLHSNKAFRQYILERDRYVCYFCGRPGDTIDHLLPRAKGGHTTPFNCVCACNECNQSKADQHLQDFIDRRK